MASKRRLRVLKHAAGVHFNIFRFEQKKGPSKGPSIFVPTIPIEKSSWLGVSIGSIKAILPVAAYIEHLCDVSPYGTN